MRYLILLAAGLAGCMAQAAPPAPPPPPPSAGTPSGSAERVAWQRVNEARQGRCPALEWSDAAARVAEAHSADMARRNYFAHVSPEGSQPGGRLTAAGVQWNAVAENIAHTPGGPEDAVRMWMGSDGHRRNIMNCVYSHTGLGEVSGRWTQVFYRPQGG